MTSAITEVKFAHLAIEPSPDLWYDESVPPVDDRPLSQSTSTEEGDMPDTF